MLKGIKMKKLLFLIAITSFLALGQTVTFPKYGQLVEFTNAFTLSSSATVQSNSFDVGDVLPKDSTKFFSVLFSSTDSCQVTITLEGKMKTSDAWTSIGTVVTNFLPVGTDSMTTKIGFVYNGNSSTAAHSGKMFSLAGFAPDLMRIKLAYTNKTTVGTSGTLKVRIKFFKD